MLNDYPLFLVLYSMNFESSISLFQTENDIDFWLKNGNVEIKTSELEKPHGEEKMGTHPPMSLALNHVNSAVDDALKDDAIDDGVKSPVQVKGCFIICQSHDPTNHMDER